MGYIELILGVGFNVPMGSYENPDIVQEERLRIVSKLLKNVTIKVMSFEKNSRYCKKKEILFILIPLITH